VLVGVHAGKGRGVFTTQAVAPGTLLLVTPPLAMVTGDMGELPELEELVTLMEEWCRWDSWQADWLRSLYRGPPEAGDTAPIPLNNTVPSAAHLPPLGSPTALWASSNATTTGHGSSGSSSGSSSRGSAAAADDAGLAASGVAAGADAGDGLVSLDGTGLDIDEVWRATGEVPGRQHVQRSAVGVGAGRVKQGRTTVRDAWHHLTATIDNKRWHCV
jgi:hypothetical protein